MMVSFNNYFTDELSAILVLEAEGRRLKYIATKVWRQYLSSYSPEQYVRTRNSQRAIKLGKVKVVSPDQLGIELTFENDLVYHDSVLGRNQKQGHSIMLISNGWKVKKGSHKDVYRFGYYEGFDYIGKVIAEYEKSKDRRVSLDVQWSGKALR